MSFAIKSSMNHASSLVIQLYGFLDFTSPDALRISVRFISSAIWMARTLSSMA